MAKITSNNILSGSITVDKLDPSVSSNLSSNLAAANNANLVATIASTVAAAAFNTANTNAAILANVAPVITSIQITDSSYNVLDDTAANTTGGFCIINGARFSSVPTVIFGSTPSPTVTYINSSTLRAQIPALTASSYPVYVVNTNGGTAIRVNGLTTSSFPAWNTAAALANTIANTVFSFTLSANSDSNIAYTNTTSLPTNTTLLSNGYFYGNVSVGVDTAFTFGVKATDAENQDANRTFSLNIMTVLDGSSIAKAAPSGYYLAQNLPGLPSGTYWIKSPSMPNALQMYVDMTEEGGGYDFYAFQGNGISVTYANESHSGTPLGLDIVYPRSKFHWRAMSNYVRNGGLAGSYQQYFRIVYGVHKTSGGGNFTSTIMRNAAFYGSGSSSHRVNDNGRWWMRDTTFGEPNGDYTAYAWFGLGAGGYSMPNPYNLEDINSNDGDSSYSTGGYYLVSTNAKP